ncbi:MAG: TonB-dependent receptor, partial [Candidatus Dadabacteria bacterium]|nr:TonB-dependent receptor [Candidatus Dadabacteria bacterium]NIQ13785.1 TonB-dependent receptor [Candidatus Dadabacteria bacterium]
MKIVLTILFAGLLFFQGTSFSEEIKVLKDVVVTATKVPTQADQLGASVEVISSEEIIKSGARDLIDVLRKVAGISVVQSGSRGADTSLFIRGGESDHNLVMIDGVQVNQPGGGFSFGRLTTENIEKIEIIKGSHSAIYGSDAIASVINIITKKGEGKRKLHLSGALGAREEDGNLIQEYSASFSGSNDLYGYFLSYGRVDDEGILEVNNDYTNNTFTATLNIDPNEDLNVALSGIYQDSKFGLATEFAGDEFDILDPDQFQENDTLVLGANVSYTSLDWWENIVALGFTREERDFEDEPNLDINPFDGSISTVEERRFTFDYRSNFFMDFNEISAVTTIGFEFENENVDDGLTDESRNNYAYYLQEQISFYNKFFITAGIRLDDNEEFGKELSPRLSLSYLLRDHGTKLRAAVGRGIKEPTFFENFGGFGLTGNTNLDPEESLSIEGGVDQKLFNELLELNFTYFWNRFENLIVFDFAGFSNGTNFENINEVKTKGVEIGGTLNPGYGVLVAVNYTFLDSEVIDDGGLGSPGGQFFEGADLIRRPEHTFNFIV